MILYLLVAIFLDTVIIYSIGGEPICVFVGFQILFRLVLACSIWIYNYLTDTEKTEYDR